jgi:hypothetical protein
MFENELLKYKILKLSALKKFGALGKRAYGPEFGEDNNGFSPYNTLSFPGFQINDISQF